MRLGSRDADYAQRLRCEWHPRDHQPLVSWNGHWRRFFSLRFQRVVKLTVWGDEGRKERSECGREAQALKLRLAPLRYTQGTITQTRVRLLAKYLKVAGFLTTIGHLQVSQAAQLSLRFPLLVHPAWGITRSGPASLDTALLGPFIPHNWLIRFQPHGIHRKLLVAAANLVGLLQIFALSARELPAFPAVHPLRT
jgi:hypothetical protein